MKYTIIIPVYNGSATLYECLRAATSQEQQILNKDYTIIVVDDGSTDNTVEIAKKFPVSLIHFAKNQGRIIARLSGAKAAQTEKLLFIDSRVIIASNAISKADELYQFPAVMGSYEARKSKYRSHFDTIFFLIRRKYYGANNFPQKEDLLYIDEKNFRRAPKGTTVLLIDKNLFIEIIPDRTDKTVNDDTLLFQKLVFKKQLPLIRANSIQFEYIQRTDMKSFIPWLYERGIRFSDFYLRPNGYFYKPFLLITTFIFLLILTAISYIFIDLKVTILILYFSLAILIASSIYLSENIKDFLISLFTFPLILAIFSSGAISHFIRKICFKKIHLK